MILKKLTLQNFRSYGETPTTVEFSSGLLLFEGEVGSGKSSILYAIEFALFGLGELESRHLIRGSAESAKVELEFEISGREYTVTRVIQRKKGKLVQTRGWIREPDGREAEYAPNELRSRILQILNFREKQGSKSSSRIYRYAIFTPQELMKEVLMQSTDERIDTLRRAFGIEDYSFAESNTEIILKNLGDVERVNSKLAQGLGEKESSLSQAKNSLSKKTGSSEILERELRDVEERVKEDRLALASFEQVSKKVTELQALIPQLEKSLAALKSQVTERKGELASQTRNLKDIEKAEFTVSSLQGAFEKYEEDKAALRELDGLQSEKLFVESQITRLRLEITKKESELQDQIVLITREYSTLEAKIQSYSKEEYSLDELEKNARALETLTVDLPKIESEISIATSEIGALNGIISTNKVEREEIKRKLGNIGELTRESTCPLCGQKLDPEHIQKVKEEFNENIGLLDNKINDAVSKLKAFQEGEKKLRARRDVCLAGLKELEEINHKISLVRGRETQVLLKDQNERLLEIKVQREKLAMKLEQRGFALDEEASLKELRSRLNSLEKELKEYALLESSVNKFETSGNLKSFENAKLKILSKQEVIDSVSTLTEKIALIEQGITSELLQIESKRKELEESQPSMLKYAKAKEELDLLLDQRLELGRRFAVLSSEIESGNKEVQRLTEELEKLKKSEAKASLYRGISSWLEYSFLPAVQDIEKYVFASINEDFNELLQRFFSTLVEEGEFSITIDDSFSPIVEQAGYELDIQSLSGGERTAVALAYRLALNYMIKQANEVLHVSLLILDEPTEGFSKQQVYRMRSVISELNCDQVIIVSHESDLETMADRVYRVEKTNGETVVTLAT